MDDVRILGIAEKLVERSRKGEVTWQETVDEDEFAVSFPDYSIVIERVRRVGLNARYRLSLMSKNGFRLDSLSPEASGGGHPDLKELFEIARRKALQVDERLDQALKALNEEGAIGLVDAP